MTVYMVKVEFTENTVLCLNVYSNKLRTICKNALCFKKAVKANRLERNLNISIPEEVYAALEKELVQNG